MSKDIYLRERLLSELAPGQEISPGIRAYFGQRLRNRVFALVLSRFAEAQARGLKKAQLARRIGKRPEVVGRLLASPGNWTLETASDLLLGISGEEIFVETATVERHPPANYSPEDLLRERAEWAIKSQQHAQQEQQSNKLSSIVFGVGQEDKTTLTGMGAYRTEQSRATHIDALRPAN